LEPDQLISKLNQIGVHFLVGRGYPALTVALSDADLLAGLAEQSDARLRLSIIHVLLQYPDFSKAASEVLDKLNDQSGLVFMLYYTAAHYLQKVYARQLESILGEFDKLPDYFSGTLRIPKTGPADEQLKRLAKRHQEITGLRLNWYGTYQHAAGRVIRRLEAERTWSTA